MAHARQQPAGTGNARGAVLVIGRCHGSRAAGVRYNIAGREMNPSGGAVSGAGLKQRLSAVLAADVAGYARLMASDQFATVAALDAARGVFRSKIESNGGRVVDMTGDSVLAAFQTATGAVNAALAFQSEMLASSGSAPAQHRMRFRVGIHLGDVVEKEDGTLYGDGVNVAARLQAMADPGSVWISGALQAALTGGLTGLFVDQGQRDMKNIPYPVRAFALRTGDAVARSPHGGSSPPPQLPNKPSVAVLPFTNMSCDPEQEYFSDGVTEDIITSLSRFRSLFVIARNSSFTFKGKSVDVRTIGRELGVCYVLEGSIRRAGNRVRVTAQLIDAVNGAHIWAEKYDRVLEDIFAVQEEVTNGIVATIAPRIDAAEREHALHRRPDDLDAYDLALRASAEAEQAYIRTDPKLRNHALSLARRSLALDPHSALALNVIAGCHGRYLFMCSDEPGDARGLWEEGVGAAAKLIELEPTGSAGYAWMGLLLVLGKRWNEALANARRGHELNPNDLVALGNLSFVELMTGRCEEALEHLQMQTRISPRDPFNYIRNSMRAAACFMLRDYVCALDHALASLSEAPNWPVAHASAAIAAVGLGNLDVARSALESARRLAPEYVAARLSGGHTYQRAEDGDRLVLAFRIAAGLEDPSAGELLRTRGS